MQKLNYKIVRWHILFWLIYFIFNVIRWGNYYDDYTYSFKSNILEFSLHIAICYFHIFYLIPNYFFKKRYVGYILLLSASIFSLYFIKSGLTYLFVNTNIWPEEQNFKAFSVNHFIAVTLGELYVLAFVTSIFLSQKLLEQRDRLHQLEKVKLEMENKFLRAQIQPHFFFNTLNSIYSLALIKSDQTPEIILKLSRIMDYVLLRINQNKVGLNHEIKCIEDYISIERLRFQNKNITFTPIAINQAAKIKIPPLILLTFVENAFKHGISNKENSISIEMNYDSENNQFYFLSKNQINANVNELTFVDTKSNGLGIENVKKRLTLSNIKHQLTIETIENEYIVSLILFLKS